MMYVVKYQKSFHTKLSAHGLETGKMNQTFLPRGKISCFQIGVSYSAMRFFNTVYSNMKCLKNDRVQFNYTM